MKRRKESDDGERTLTSGREKRHPLSADHERERREPTGRANEDAKRESMSGGELVEMMRRCEY